MLILTRRISEKICIGDDVTVQVLGVKGNQVRIGITAPKTVAVNREEIAKRIAREGADRIGPDRAYKPVKWVEPTNLPKCDPPANAGVPTYFEACPTCGSALATRPDRSAYCPQCDGARKGLR